MSFMRIAMNFGDLNDFQEYLNTNQNWKRNKQRTEPTLAHGPGPADRMAGSA
jgi:hypothetical protein